MATGRSLSRRDAGPTSGGCEVEPASCAAGGLPHFNSVALPSALARRRRVAGLDRFRGRT